MLQKGQCSLIQELMLYKFELGYYTTEITATIRSAKVEGTVDCSTVTSWFKKFCLDCKNLNYQVSSNRPKSMDCLAVLQVKEKNPMISTQRILGEFGISQSCVVHYLHNLFKSIQSC